MASIANLEAQQLREATLLLLDTKQKEATFEALEVKGLVERALCELNEAVQRGKVGREYRARILELNQQLVTGTLGQSIREEWQLEEEEIGNLAGLQIAVPLSRSEEVGDYILSVLKAIVVTINEIFFVLPVYVISSFWAYSNRDPVEPPKGQDPIFLVHSMNFNQSEWMALRSQLHSWGYTSVYTLNLDDNIFHSFGTIEEYSAKLQEKMNAVLQRIQEREGRVARAICIGHSMGGIVSAHAALQGRVKALMTLGSPFYGTDLSNAFKKIGLQINQVQSQLAPESELLAHIRTRVRELEERGQLQLFHARCDFDSLVHGREGTTGFLSKDPRRQHTAQWIGHLGLVLNPHLHHRLRTWLGRM